MKRKTTSPVWTSIPILPCISIEQTLAFWAALQFEITYKQTRPYQYGVVMYGDAALHFAGVKGLEAKSNAYTGCLIVVDNAADVYHRFCETMRQSFGSVAHSGIPRISRMKTGATRFTLTDVAGNAVIFVSRSNRDQENWEEADSNDLQGLRKAIARAKRFRDYKNDDAMAARTLDVALKKTPTEDRLVVAEALIMRIELATAMKETTRGDQCRTSLEELSLTKEERLIIASRH